MKLFLLTLLVVIGVAAAKPAKERDLKRLVELLEQLQGEKRDEESGQKPKDAKVPKDTTVYRGLPSDDEPSYIKDLKPQDLSLDELSLPLERYMMADLPGDISDVADAVTKVSDLTAEAIKSAKANVANIDSDGSVFITTLTKVVHDDILEPAFDTLELRNVQKKLVALALKGLIGGTSGESQDEPGCPRKPDGTIDVFCMLQKPLMYNEARTQAMDLSWAPLFADIEGRTFEFCFETLEYLIIQYITQQSIDMGVLMDKMIQTSGCIAKSVQVVKDRLSPQAVSEEGLDVPDLALPKLIGMSVMQTHIDDLSFTGLLTCYFAIGSIAEQEGIDLTGGFKKKSANAFSIARRHMGRRHMNI